MKRRPAGLQVRQLQDTCRAPRSWASPVKYRRSSPAATRCSTSASFTRQAAVSGNLRGFIPGRFKPNTDIQVTLTHGSITLGQTPRLHRRRLQRPGVARRSAPATRPASLLDSDTTSSTTLFASGTATAIVVHDGPASARAAQRRHGLQRAVHHDRLLRVQADVLLARQGRAPSGLTKLRLTSPPDILNVVACLSPGVPTQPCNGFQIPLPILVSDEADRQRGPLREVARAQVGSMIDGGDRARGRRSRGRSGRRVRRARARDGSLGQRAPR